MKIEIDPKLKATGERARKRRRLRGLRRVGFGIAMGIGGVILVAGVGVLLRSIWGEFRNGEAAPEDGDALVQIEQTTADQVIVSAAGAEAFLNIRGAPMILTLPEGPTGLGPRRLLSSAPIGAARFPGGTEFSLIDDTLLDPHQLVQLAIPSSSSDLAAFNARRDSTFDAPPPPFAPPPSGAPLPSDLMASAGQQIDVDDGAGSWGEVIGEDGKSDTSQSVSYVATQIEDTTTTGQTSPPAERNALYTESLEHIDLTVPLRDVLITRKLSEAEADRLISALKRIAEQGGRSTDGLVTLEPGSLVAMRLDPSRTEATILQISLYGPTDYLLTLAQPRAGRFVAGADPWFSRDLRREANKAIAARGAQGKLRLKDAVYSAALRQGMPSDLVGELLVMLARVQDLEQIADEKDRLRILYADAGDGPPAARIAYAAVSGPEIDLQCYVNRADRQGAPYACVDPRKPESAPAAENASGLLPGFIVPVVGTKTSGFGPRFHPILKKTVNHNGLDWGAPVGTPVHAAADGKIARVERQAAYGNIIFIDHASGFQTRYAHLNAFAPGISAGQAVQAGQLIGFVGTTGRSTGPHLHFEVLQNGTAIDPAGSAHGSDAVEALVAQIIRVESAGNHRAQNTRSTATGLGQFIESTWLRMMQTYRPDLARSLDRAALLGLRFDPALSREMVTNLARENESYLRARGHAITPGRLYLAHFLGPGGADLALATARTRPDAPVLEVMGSGVVGANPFLTGWSLADLASWADRKMGRPSLPAPTLDTAPTTIILSDAIKSYVAAVGGLLDQL